MSEKLHISFQVLNGRGEVKSSTRIVKYDSEKNAFLGKHGDGFRDIEESVMQLLTSTNPDNYEIKVEESTILYRWQINDGMTNWRKLSFRVVR